MKNMRSEQRYSSHYSENNVSPDTDSDNHCKQWADRNHRLYTENSPSVSASGHRQAPEYKESYAHNLKEDKYMVFAREAYEPIRQSVGKYPAETGGILLGSRSDYIVRKFIFDESGSRSPGGYDPDINFLNPVVKEEWRKNRLALIGFVHSHPRGISRLSGDFGNGIGDIGYLKRIFDHIPALDRFLVPIIYSEADGRNFEIFPYIARPDSVRDYTKAEVKFLDGYNAFPKETDRYQKHRKGEMHEYRTTERSC